MDAKLLVIFPVSVLSNIFYPRDECPGDVTEWNKDKHQMNCSSPDYIYHCLPDDNRKLGEICTKGPAVRVQKGYCPEYNHNAGTITTVLCNTTGCPTLPFYSNEVYQFPMCLTTDDGRKVQGKEILSVPAMRIIIAVAVLLLLLLIGTICVILRRKMKEIRRSDAQKTQLSKKNKTPIEIRGSDAQELQPLSEKNKTPIALSDAADKQMKMASNLPQENIISDYMIGEKKLSVLEYRDGILVELEAQNSKNKCVSLDVKRWKYFCDNIEQIQEAVKQYLIRGREGEYKLHLGKDLFLSVKNGIKCVDFRKWFKNDNNYLKPTTNGVALSLKEFENLIKILPDINGDIPDLESITPCQYTHNVEALCDHCKQSAPFES